MTRRQPAWSVEEDAYALAAIRSGMSFLELAGKLERTETAVRARLLKLGSNDPELDVLYQRYVQAKANTTNRQFKAHFRDDLNTKFRSSWEANVARWFNAHGIQWEYEPRVFRFDRIKRGTKTYIPDFWLPQENVWVEVKGYLPNRDRTKLKRFRLYFPDQFARLRGVPRSATTTAALGFNELGVPVYAYYNDIAKEAPTIPEWEPA